jgi:hypothetical protein
MPPAPARRRFTPCGGDSFQGRPQALAASGFGARLVEGQ